MSRAYDMWVHKQLEPTDIIITGNRKRYHEIKKELILGKPPVKLSEAEDNRLQDEYLKSKGIL